MYFHKIKRGKQQPQINVIRMWHYTVMLVIFTPRAPKLYLKPNILLSIQEPCSSHALQKLFQFRILLLCSALLFIGSSLRAHTKVPFALRLPVYLSPSLHASLWIESIWKAGIKCCLSVDSTQLLPSSVYMEGTQYMSVGLDQLHGHFMLVNFLCQPKKSKNHKAHTQSGIGFS